MMTLTLQDAPRVCDAQRPAERRRGLRVRQSRPIKVFEPGTSRVFGGHTRDISATGLRIELPTDAMIEPGEILNIHVGPNQIGQTLANRRQLMPVRVVWVERSWGQPMLKAGVEYLASIAAQLDAA